MDGGSAGPERIGQTLVSCPYSSIFMKGVHNNGQEKTGTQGNYF